MSRSKHTTPPRIRASRRVRAPYAPRGQGDRSDQQTLARLLKEQGIVADGVDDAEGDEQSVLWPRRRAPFYDRALEMLSQEQSEAIFLEDLEAY